MNDLRIKMLVCLDTALAPHLSVPSSPSSCDQRYVRRRVPRKTRIPKTYPENTRYPFPKSSSCATAIETASTSARQAAPTCETLPMRFLQQIVRPAVLTRTGAFSIIVQLALCHNCGFLPTSTAFFSQHLRTHTGERRMSLLFQQCET